MNSRLALTKNIIAAALFLSPTLAPRFALAQTECNNTNLYYEAILTEVSKKNPNAIENLPECFKTDRNLIFKTILIDPDQFQNASEILQQDEVFVARLLIANPTVLKYCAPEIRGNAAFMEKATYLNRDSLRYASWSLLDNKLFMKKMIEIDSRNYKFASDRIKEIPEIAEMAFEDDGMLLEFAPKNIRSDKKLVKIALLSNSSAFDFASNDLRQDRELQKMAEKKSSIKSTAELQKFLSENYVGKNADKKLGEIFLNQGKFFTRNKIIQRNYVTKWQRTLNFNRAEKGGVGEDLRLISADSRNYPNLWKQDLRDHPELIQKIENFFLRHNVAHNTIENLRVNFLWKIKDQPLTLAFNLYLLRDSTDENLGADFSDVTSLTAIVQKTGNKWHMSVIEVIFDNEIKIDISYQNGHRRYFLWDLYLVEKNDKNPKIIFKVDDSLSQYLEVYEEQVGGKYRMIYKSNSLPNLKGN